MIYKVFGAKQPQKGVLVADKLLPLSITRGVNENGVWRGNCPCCGREIVVRAVAKGAAGVEDRS